MVEPLKNATAEEKASAKLSCRLSAVPKDVCWFKGQTSLEASSKYVMKQNGPEVQLLIHALSPDDAGEYRCHTGTCETKAVLTVEGKVHHVDQSSPILFLEIFPAEDFGFNHINQQSDHYLAKIGVGF